MRNSTSQKIAIIKEVIEDKKSVYSVCKKYNLSKMTFYKWLSIYKKARKNRHASFANSIKEGNNHYKSLGSAIKFKVLSYVHSNPNLSCHQIARSLDLGNHAVQNLLEKEGLNRVDERVEYSKKPFWKRETQERRQGMMELFEQGWQIDSICRHYKISKPTFFKWRQRYFEAKELGRLLALSDRYVSGSVHHKYIDESVKDKVVELVAQNPDWSVHKIAASVTKSEGKLVIGHHAIQDLLLIKDLNTMEKRRLYAQGYVRQLAPAIQIYDTPVPGLSIWRLLYAPFKTVPKWVFGHPASWPIVFPLTIFLVWIIEVDKLLNPAFFFPTVALTFGMFFFLYSLKYYFSLIMVMKIAQNGEGASTSDAQLGQEPQSFAMRIKNFVPKFIKISQPISNVNPLTLNFSKVELRLRPFVSIHAPIYNEKRVVERLIRACSSQNWIDDISGKANFEVVIIDDSTDETTEIAKQFLREKYGELRLIRDDKGTEIYRANAIHNLPSFTLIHRASRAGYKGAALGSAMSYIDPRAEYVCVFDADFVPYPDTIEQFMKSFQEACGGLEKVAESKIAAVQGYQWHVLNKSENWVTRGVRTEYAGSYVVERAGIGIYGGLNQIAGSVFCIRADVLKAFGWRTSITEDLQLTLRLYEQGFKVVFNPYIQAPAEAVSTVRRLIRQRMRWAEGHTFNVKQMWQKMMYSKRISGREKFEFMYLAPYYLQAAFFLIGVTAWFISEVVLHTRLPFWTAAWGWSLVFTNFLALPLMNLAGLFLEESEEKDYAGVASFMLLSYIVVPFQAYAAVKALFEKEEGPWFRTPKSGLITNDYNRGQFYGWIEKLKMLGGAGATSSVQCEVKSVEAVGHGGFGGGLNFARVTAHNPLQGYRIMPRRAPRVSRGVIALLLAVVVILNYAAFFVPTAQAASSTPALEQQINLIDQTITAGGTNTGVICLTPGSYDGTVTYYFEVVEKLSGAGTGGATLTYDAGTCSSGGTPAAPSGGSTVAISTSMTTSYARYRSTSFTPTGGMAYVSGISGTGATINAARIIITQTHATKLTKTETQVEIGNNETTISTSAINLSAFKQYCFDSTSTGTACAAASPSRFSPVPTIYFEATLKSSNASGTATAGLYNAADTLVTSSAVSVSDTTWKIVRSSAITLTAGTVYKVKINTNNASYTTSIASAKIVLVQSDATNGLTAVETVQEYINTQVSTTSTTFVGQNLFNLYAESNFSGSMSTIHEADIKTLLGKNSTGKANVEIITGISNTGSVTTTLGAYTRVRASAVVSSASEVYDAQIKCDTCNVANDSVQSSKNWLIIQTQSMPVPEIALVALPGMFLLPKIVAWFKRREQGKVKKGGFGKINKGKFIKRLKTPLGLLARKSIKFKLGGFG